MDPNDNTSTSNDLPTNGNGATNAVANFTPTPTKKAQNHPPAINHDDSTIRLFENEDVMFIVFGFMHGKTDLMNVSLSCHRLNRAVKANLFRFMTLPGIALGLHDPEYDVLRAHLPDNGENPGHGNGVITRSALMTRVLDSLAQTKSLSVSQRLIASAIPFTAPQFLREDWGLDDVEQLGQCHEIYRATAIILSGTKELRHLEFQGFHMWLNVLKLLHIREVHRDYRRIQSIKITPPDGRPNDFLRSPGGGKLYSEPALVAEVALILTTYFQIVGPHTSEITEPQVDENLKVDMSMLLGLKGGVIPVFNFSDLTILALHGLGPSRAAPPMAPSYPYLRPLVLVLKNAPQLRCLELSTVNYRVWGAYSDHEKYPWDDRNGGKELRLERDMMRMLCHAYKKAGGLPLQHLRYLRLGPGCLLESPRNGQPREDLPHHYLSYLFKLSGLVELHLEYPLIGNSYIESFVEGQPWFVAAIYAARLLINVSHLPKLRKLSLPHKMWYYWNMFFPPNMEPNGWGRTLGYTAEQGLTMRFLRYAADYGHEPLDLRQLPPLSGLILPTEHMDFGHPMNLRQLVDTHDLKSVKLMFPSLCLLPAGKCIPHYPYCRSFSPTDPLDCGDIRDSLRNHPDLRDLWLAGDYEGPRVEEDEFNEETMRSAHYRYQKMIRHAYLHHGGDDMELAAKVFFLNFPHLEYVRILHRAWRRETRKVLSPAQEAFVQLPIKAKIAAIHELLKENGGYSMVKAGGLWWDCEDPELCSGIFEHTGSHIRELTRWEVENDIPEAFDYRTPSLFYGRQYR